MLNDVLKEILEWSKERPAWQRDVLRRVFAGEELTATDVDDLVDLCKAAHGLSEHRKAEVLTERHLAIQEEEAKPISLVSVTHESGVNALARNQTVAFGSHLTIAYGPNAAGKSGYSRILKLACRSRFNEQILCNVLTKDTPVKPQVIIRYRTGTTEVVPPWNFKSAPSNALSAVSVFDARCAPVYLRDKTDVAFRPFSLDIFDRLSAACGSVRSRLESEIQGLNAASARLPSVHEGTGVQTVLANLTSLTSVENVRALATLSDAETKRLRDLREQRRDIQAADPQKRSRELTSKADRIQLVERHIALIGERLSNAPLETLRTAIQSREVASKAVAMVRETTLAAGHLPGTGGEEWRKMWEAAGIYSATAYPSAAFPITKSDARCPLCQQVIGPAAATRLKHFAEYIESTAQAELRAAETNYTTALNRITQVTIEREEITLALNELTDSDLALAQAVRTYLAEAVRLQKEVSVALGRGRTELPARGLDSSPETALNTAGQALRARAVQLQHEKPVMKPEAIVELKEMESRETLGQNLQVVLDEIERKKRIAAYQQCLNDTTTQPITRKSTELTKRLISDHLRDTFQQELAKLEFNHLAVAIQPAGGARGALFHQLVFTNAPGVVVTDVLSEGESRTLSLAAFLTELTTAATKSAIIFDDPVSSLDHVWRGRIARRLVVEAKERQVIVFTHDLLFLRLLLDECQRQSVDCQHQYIRREAEAGICSTDLPWIAMNVKDRIGKLRERWQAAEKTFRTSGAEAYERDARDIYGLLREAWEQAVSEVLLNGVVERYRHSIETQRVRHLHDISEQDCTAVFNAMTECSRWIRGHDQPLADAAPFPQPSELQKHIQELDDWVRAVNKRRN